MATLIEIEEVYQARKDDICRSLVAQFGIDFDQAQDVLQETVITFLRANKRLKCKTKEQIDGLFWLRAKSMLVNSYVKRTVQRNAEGRYVQEHF